MKYFITLCLFTLVSISCLDIDQPTVEDLICELSTELNAINITETTAVIIWKHPNKGGEETYFRVEYGLKGFELGTGSLSDETNFKNIIIIDLEPATEYQYYIRTTCDNDVIAITAGPSEFVTD